MKLKLKELGERNIINEIYSAQAIKQTKDDCALIDMGDKYFLISTDSISTKSHIPEGTPTELIGKFLASLNLSDIAAMAGDPIGFMTAFSLDPDTDFDFLMGIERGIKKVLDKYGVENLGGDLKEGPDEVMTGIAVGSQKKDLVRKRSDIRIGQIVGVTNSLGRAASGYVYYKSKFNRTVGINLLLDFEPKLREAKLISEYGGKFMMDLSDGLFSSIYQMKHDYGVGFKIVEDELPMHRHVEKAADLSGATALELMGSFGGDYELLFTIDNSNYGNFIEAMKSEKIDVSFIGDVWDGDNMIYDGQRWNLIQEKGYEHFSKHPQLGRIN